MVFQQSGQAGACRDEDRGVTVRCGGSRFRPDVGVAFPIIVFEHSDWCVTLPFRCHSIDYTYEFPKDENGNVRAIITYGESPRRVLVLDQKLPAIDDSGRALPSDISDIIREGAPAHYFGKGDFHGATEVHLGETPNA